MRIKNLKEYTLYKKAKVVDEEGNIFEDFEKEGNKIKANIYPASGKLQAEVYGLRLKYILNMLCDNTVDIKEGDGVVVYNATSPDYRVISIKRYTHLAIELEKI